jgi:hypothetical protein
MAKTKFALKALLLIASLGVAQDAAAANILVNGSFEDPVQGGRFLRLSISRLVAHRLRDGPSFRATSILPTPAATRVPTLAHKRLI